MKEKISKIWIPLWVDKWLFGSTRIELEPDERGVFVDLMVLAAKDNGYIRANEITPYPPRQLAGLLNIPEELLLRSLKKCTEYLKLEESPPGIYRFLHWEKYQFTDRWKRELNGDTSVKTEATSQNKEAIKQNRIKQNNIRNNKIEEKKEDIPLPPLKAETEQKEETAIQFIVRQYKQALGVPETDKAWDKARFARLARPAGEIIEAFQGDEIYATRWASNEILRWKAWAEKNNKSFSLERIAQAAQDAKGKYLEEKAQEEKENGYSHNAEKMGINNANQRPRIGGMAHIGEIAAGAIKKISAGN